MVKRLCCLCSTSQTNQYKHLQNCLGDYNEIYGIVVKYFDPKLITECIKSKSCEEAIICQNCWLHLSGFQNFQRTILKIKNILEQSALRSPLTLQVVEENVPTVISGDYNVDEEFKQTNSSPRNCDLQQTILKLETPLQQTSVQGSLVYIKDEDQHVFTVFSDDYNFGNTENSFAKEHHSAKESPMEEQDLVKNHLEDPNVEDNVKIVNAIAHTSLNTANLETNVLYENCFFSEENSTAVSRSQQQQQRLNKALTNDLENLNHLREEIDNKGSTKKVNVSDKLEESFDETENVKFTSFKDKHVLKTKRMRMHNDTTKSQPEMKAQLKRKQCTDDKTLQGKDQIIAEWKPHLVCDICTAAFRNFKLLNCHFKEKHKTQAYVKCCNSTYRSRYALAEHVRLHFNPELNKCEICGKLCVSKGHLADHKKNKHASQKFKCDICGKIFSYQNGLKRHVLTHTEGNRDFKCEECGKDYVHEVLLKIHIRQSHKKVTCERCGKIVNSRSIVSHMKRHTDLTSAKLPCDECGKKLATPASLKCHKKKFHSGVKLKFSCDECGKELASPSTLKAHKKTYHNDCSKVKYPCTECGKDLATLASLKHHKEMLHTVDYEPKFSCDKCGKKIRTRNVLKHHKEICHNEGSTIYVCSICGKVSPTEARLRYHRKNAHEKKGKPKIRKRKRKCPYCDKVFNYARYAREHVARYHIKKPLYQCGHCPKSFYCYEIYRRHNKKVHLINNGEIINKKIDYDHVKNIAII